MKGSVMNRPLIDRILIVFATACGAIVSVWWTNSLAPVLGIATVAYIAMLQHRTDDGDALREAAGQVGAQRRTRRRDDE
jgi:hypothetical protein